MSLLAQARRFGAWCEAQGRLSADPTVTRLRKALADMTQQRNEALAMLQKAGGAE